LPLQGFQIRIIQYAGITTPHSLRKVTQARQGTRTDNQELNRRPLGINHDTTKFGPAGYDDDESDDDDDDDDKVKITIKSMIEITLVMTYWR
jgi:hypothetical protein